MAQHPLLQPLSAVGRPVPAFPPSSPHPVAKKWCGLGTSSSWHEAFAEEDAGAWAAGAGDCSAAVLIGMLNMLCQHGAPLSWSLVLVFKNFFALCVFFFFYNSLVYFSSPLLMLGNTLRMDYFIAIILRQLGWWLKNSKIFCHIEDGMKGFENGPTDVFIKPVHFPLPPPTHFFLKTSFNVQDCAEAAFKGFSIHSSSSLKWKRQQGTSLQLNPWCKRS